MSFESVTARRLIASAEPPGTPGRGPLEVFEARILIEMSTTGCSVRYIV